MSQVLKGPAVFQQIFLGQRCAISANWDASKDSEWYGAHPVLQAAPDLSKVIPIRLGAWLHAFAMPLCADRCGYAS
eukprot:9407888-Alexandrium_andersonii.AAC.1